MKVGNEEKMLMKYMKATGEEYFSERFNILHGKYDYCIIQKMWLQLGILGLIFATMMIVMLASAELQVWIDLATESLKKV